jgi:hypothetical protein
MTGRDLVVEKVTVVVVGAILQEIDQEVEVVKMMIMESLVKGEVLRWIEREITQVQMALILKRRLTVPNGRRRRSYELLLIERHERGSRSEKKRRAGESVMTQRGSLSHRCPLTSPI